MVYNVEKMFRENGDKISGDERQQVETALSDAKTTLTGTPSSTELRAAYDRLTKESHKLAEAMYKSGAAPMDGAAAAAGTTAEAPRQEEGVIDAEYVDVDHK